MTSERELREHGASSMVPALPRRVADWYELFFDLVFVVVVAVAVHLIEVQPTLQTVLEFVLLLFPVWWAWVNLMVTNNLFGDRMPVIGVLVVAAMPGPAAMAIAIASGIGEFAWLYALGAVWIRLVLLTMWLVARAARRRAGAGAIGAAEVGPGAGTDAEAGPAGARFGERQFGARSTEVLWRSLLYNLGTALVWLVSAVIAQPWNFVLWGIAVGSEVALLAWRSRFSSEIYGRASISHALDRIGLFVVIVIGEAVYLSVTGLAEHPTAVGAVAGLFGFIVCALLARAFFRWGIPTTELGLEDAQRRQSYGALRDVVMYLPYLLIIGLTFVAAAIGIAVVEASVPLPLAVRVLLALGVSLVFVTSAMINLRLGRPPRRVIMVHSPGVLLTVLACLASGALPAWVSMALVALALVISDAVSFAVARAAGLTAPPHAEV